MKVKTPLKKKDVGLRRLYIMRFVIPEYNGVLHKIGVTSGSNAKKRMLGVIGSYFDTYRLTPIVKIVRDREVLKGVFTKERMLHKYFKKYAFKPARKFSGSTEFFAGVPEEELILRYLECLSGVNINGKIKSIKT